MLKKIRQHVFAIPMVFSLVLLSGLLVYWLIGEYNEAKRVASLEESMDKMIMYIKDLNSKDSLGLTLDTLSVHSFGKVNGQFKYVINDSQDIDQIKKIKLFQQGMKTEGNVTIKVMDSLPEGHDLMDIQEIISNNGSHETDKSISYYLSKIVPQISFAVLLFLTTLIAFVLVWRNWWKEKQLTRFRDDFISNISHELKTPINIIGVAIEAMDSFNVQENPKLMTEYMSISKLELERLNTLVDKAIAMDVPDEESLGASMQKMNLLEELMALVRVHQVKFSEINATLNFQHQGANFDVIGDPVHLSNVFYNLLDNAVKYKSEKVLIVTIDLLEKDDVLEVKMVDNGIGIEPSYHKNIFQKFFRVPQDNRHNVKGHGLGLNYVKKIIQLHRGKIVVDSKIGVGSSFVVTLPKVV